MKPRFLSLLLIAGLLLLTGCEQTQLPADPTTAPPTVPTTSPTVAVTVPTAPPTTAPTTAPTTEPEPPKWLRKEAHMTYEEYFAEDRQYARDSDDADQRYSWYIMEGDVGTVYDLSWEESIIGKSLYLSDHSAGTREWYYVPENLASDGLLCCDGKYAYFIRTVRELPLRPVEIVRLDMETKTVEPIIRIDGIRARYLCGNAVLYAVCRVEDSLQVCRIYLPEARVDILCTIETEPRLFFYSLHCPESTLGDVSWAIGASELDIKYIESYHCADGTVTREPYQRVLPTPVPEPELIEGEWQFIGTELQGTPPAEGPENAVAVILGNGFRAGNPGYYAEGKVIRLSEDMALEAVEGTEGIFCITEENEVLQLSWDGSIRNVLYAGGEKPLGNLVYWEGFLYLTEGENILQLRVEDGASRVLIHQPGLYRMRFDESENGLYFSGGIGKAFIYYFGADDFYETT